CVERCERSDRTSDHSRHPGGRTRSAEAGGVSGSPGQGQRERDRAEPGGELARGSIVRAEAGTSELRVLPEAGGRVRSPAPAASPRNGGSEPRGQPAGRETKG